MTKLVDQYGNPLRRSELLEEQATPSITGVRSFLTAEQTTGLNPGRLARILRATEDNDATAYLEMAEEIEEKDTHYLAVIGTRKRAVSQLEITVEPASENDVDVRNAQLIEDWLRRDHLETEIFDILDAIGKGYSVVEILWDVNDSIWLPKDLKWRDPRWFEFDRTDRETLMMKGDDNIPVPLAPYKFIVHRHKAKSGITVRGGIIRPCAWMWLFKNFSIKDWVIFAEAYGQPIRMGKYGPGASKADKDVLRRAVAQIGSDAAAIIPESMQIEFIEAAGKTNTADVFDRLCKFCDQQISKAVLGQTTTVDAISGGHAVSKEHNEVREDIERADARQLAATLNEQLIRPMIDLNYGEQKRYPRLRIGRSEQIDSDKLSMTAERAVNIGLKISSSKLREKLGLPAPVDDNDILQKPAASAPVNNPPENTSLASARPNTDKDAIDQAIDEIEGDFEEIMNPIVNLLEEAADQSEDFDDFRQKLLTLAGEIDMNNLANQLARMGFKARVAGNLEIDLDE